MAKCGSKKQDKNTTSIRAFNNDRELEVCLHQHDLSGISGRFSTCNTQIESGNYLWFHQCNVFLVILYRKATKDYKMKSVTAAFTQLVPYGGLKLQGVGNV